MNRRIALALAGTAIVAVVAGPARADGSYDVSHTTDTYAEPGSTAGAAAEIDPAGAFGMEAAIQEDKPNATLWLEWMGVDGLTHGRAEVLAQTTLLLGPGAYEVAAVVDQLNGSMTRTGAASALTRIDVSASCDGCVEGEAASAEAMSFDPIPAGVQSQTTRVENGRATATRTVTVPSEQLVTLSVSTRVSVGNGRVVTKGDGLYSSDPSQEPTAVWVSATAHAPGAASVQLTGAVASLTAVRL